MKFRKEINLHTLEANRKLLYKQQSELRETMMSFKKHDTAMAFFYRQHAQLHSAKMSNTNLWSFADAVLNDLTEAQIRQIPKNNNHSIAWCLWHIARIEDATMNLLVAGKPQLFNQENWLSPLKVQMCNTGNEVGDDQIAQLSAVIDVDALRAYRIAVGQRTRQIVSELKAEQLKEKVKPERIQTLLAEGVLVEDAKGLSNYWGNRTLAGLLLMPATRHNMSHLNEALRLRKKVR